MATTPREAFARRFIFGIMQTWRERLARDRHADVWPRRSRLTGQASMDATGTPMHRRPPIRPI
jgi:hypothetical protein